MRDAEPKCLSCGVAYTAHGGLSVTCAALNASEREVARLRAELRKANEHMDRDFETIQKLRAELTRVTYNPVQAAWDSR